ncbi:MAG TPA: AAA family ATPase [Planctomycetota bacterium]|nr:AAA family ATPase [Planctomycetota bacterium]HRT95312.1 AAA family ATPase [Planctomycetota bacterium]
MAHASDANGSEEKDVEAGFPTVLDVLQDIFRDVRGDPEVSVTVVKANKLASEGKSLLVYGDSGRGKTWCVGSLPVGLTLIIDFDRGVETLSRTEHDIVRPESFEELVEIYEGLRDGTLKYRFVALDSLSELEKAIQAERKRSKKRTFATLKEHAETSELLRDIVRHFRDLRTQGITTVFTCLEMPFDVEMGEDQTVTKHVPLVSRKFALELCGLVDLVGRLVVNPATGDRELHFAGNNEFIAKTRVHCVNPVEPPDLTALFRKIYGIKPPAEGEQAKAAEPAAEQPKPTKPPKNGKAAKTEDAA